MSAASKPQKTAYIYAALASGCFGAWIVASIVSDGVPIGAALFVVAGIVFAAIAGDYWYKPPSQPADRGRR